MRFIQSFKQFNQLNAQKFDFLGYCIKIAAIA